MRRSGAPSVLARKLNPPGKENVNADPVEKDVNSLTKSKVFRREFRSPVSKLIDTPSANLSRSPLEEVRSNPSTQEIVIPADLIVEKPRAPGGRNASQVIKLLQPGQSKPVDYNIGEKQIPTPSATASSPSIVEGKDEEAAKNDIDETPISNVEGCDEHPRSSEVSFPSRTKRSFPVDEDMKSAGSDVKKQVKCHLSQSITCGLPNQEVLPQSVKVEAEDALCESDVSEVESSFGQATSLSKNGMSVNLQHNSQLHVSPLHRSNASGARGHGQQQELPSEYYSVMYCVRKMNAKRKGPWSDGIIVCQGRSCNLQDLEGKSVSKGIVQGLKDMPEGASLEIGKFEVEVMRRVSKEEVLAGSLYLLPSAPQSVALKPVARTIKRLPLRGFKSVGSHQPRDKGLYIPSMDSCVLNEGVPTEVPVVVDPYIASKLRPHQKDGVKFMYECVMGMRSKSFLGCLLADEMGLGKTLQVITLIWTLVKQGPTGCPPVKRILVVCPSSLVQNWSNEVQKWLGRERLKFMAVHAGTTNREALQKFSDFKAGQVSPLLITSYELLRKHMDKIASAEPGLLICDEAHRLKNWEMVHMLILEDLSTVYSAGNKTIDALVGLQCPRKILLTGTPVQNDLNEFYAMMDFANPGLLGSLSAFKRIFAEPIQLSQDRTASLEEQEIGTARSRELQTRTNFCILRRTAEINKSYLPTKTELFVFCRLQPLQISIYKIIVNNATTLTLALQALRSLYISDNTSATILSSITTLRKLCSHPQLIRNNFVNETNLEPASDYSHSAAASRNSDIDQLFQESADKQEETWAFSGKLSCLYQLLRTVYTNTSTVSRDRVVLVSNFTKTLDIIQAMCTNQGWQFLRLDGSTDAGLRQALVDQLNSGFGEVFVFLLSAKAGGTGLNLIGANRLVLFDPDWNPATDAQAIARVWREGQLKPVIIYRFFSTGSIEEKIFQRQIMKGGMAASLEADVAGKSKKSTGGRHFSKEELRELFTLNLETQCDTFDLISRTNSASAKSWRDHSEDNDDYALHDGLQSGIVSFVYNVGRGQVSLLK